MLCREGGRQFVELRHHDVQLVDLAERNECFGYGRFIGGRLLNGAERERNATEVDHVVGHDSGDDLPTQRMGIELGVEPFPKLLGEVRTQGLPEPRIVREIALTQCRCEFDLRVSREYRKLGRGQPLPLFQAFPERRRCR
ncbi:hypothetical protein D9M72_490880 [compost metagenome]